MKKDLLVSIIYGSNHGYIYECVVSIHNWTKKLTYDIVVIDNCTGDPNLNKLNEMGAKVIVNKKTQGFAENHAQVLSMIDSYRYLIIFNDDAYLMNNAFKIMLDAMATDKRLAIAGCHIADPDGGLQPSAAPFPTLKYFVTSELGLGRNKGEGYPNFFMNYIDFDKTQSVDWVSGCCMLLRTEFIMQHGFLDTGYFMFLEDADICLRASILGKKVKYIAEAKIIHHRGVSSRDKNGAMKPLLYVEKQRSRLRFLKKLSSFKYSIYFVFINVFFILKIGRLLNKRKIERANELLKLLRCRPLW